MPLASKKPAFAVLRMFPNKRRADEIAVFGQPVENVMLSRMSVAGKALRLSVEGGGAIRRTAVRIVIEDPGRPGRPVKSTIPVERFGGTKAAISFGVAPGRFYRKNATLLVRRASSSWAEIGRGGPPEAKRLHDSSGRNGSPACFVWMAASSGRCDQSHLFG